MKQTLNRWQRFKSRYLPATKHDLIILGELIMKELDDLTAEVEEVKTVQQSAITLLLQLSQLIRDAGTDPVKLAQLATDLDNSSKALAEAVVANTPAAIPPQNG